MSASGRPTKLAMRASNASGVAEEQAERATEAARSIGVEKDFVIVASLAASQPARHTTVGTE